VAAWIGRRGWRLQLCALSAVAALCTGACAPENRTTREDAGVVIDTSGPAGASGAPPGSGGIDGGPSAGGSGGSGSDAGPIAGSGGAGTAGAGTDGGGAGVDSSLGDGASDAGMPDGGHDASTADDLCNAGVYNGVRPQPLRLSGNTFAHDPTLIEADGVFYRFWTGDNIPMATSTNLTEWRNGPAVYRQGYPRWVTDWLRNISGQTFNFPWAPDVSYFGGRYHLYSSFSAKFGDNISCITHLTTTDIAAGSWTDHGPVLCTQGNERYNAIDADVALDENGTPWLAFGSFWDGIMVIELDQNGDRVGTSMTRLAWAREIEAPVLFRRCGYYYLFVTFGLCCPGEGRSVNQLSYRVVVGRSENILGPYVDRNGVRMLDGGGTLVVGGDGTQFAAAGHSDVLVTGDKIYHLYHAYRLPTGRAELRIVEMPFDDEGWPVPAGP
jgi:arabinan endo-1,5-alpha-L-arabinosidase